MECYECERWTGVACINCGRPICDSHRAGNTCKDALSCEEIVKELEQRPIKDPFPAPFGHCACGLSLVKHLRDRKSKRPSCPIHGYSTEKTAKVTR